MNVPRHRLIAHDRDVEKQSRASAIYEELRALDAAELVARARRVGIEPGLTRQQTIAVVVERELEKR